MIDEIQPIENTMKLTSLNKSRSEAKKVRLRNWLQTFAICVAMSSIAIPFTSHAGPGHDHGDEAPVSVGEASPRIALRSELFEAVGILKGNTLEIYVDHAQSNAPVENAALELELNGAKVPLELHASGEFDAVLPASITQSHSDSPISVALKITAGEQEGLLTGQLVMPHADEHAAGEDSHSHGSSFLKYGYIGLLALVLAALGMRWNKKRKLLKEVR